MVVSTVCLVSCTQQTGRTAVTPADSPSLELRSVPADPPEPAAGISTAAPLVTVRVAADGNPSRDSDIPRVAAVLTDLETFWTENLPGGGSFTPPAGGYVAVAASAGAIQGGPALCISAPGQIAGNAFYCPAQDGIVYDSSTLVPVLLGHYGDGALVASLAHEYGHAIQARIGPTEADRTADPARYPTLLIELQADCYAGAFLSWAEAGHAAHLRIPAAALPSTIGPLLDFRDSGRYPQTDPNAHGLAVDRLRAVLAGLAGGADSCHRLELASLHPAQGRSGVGEPGTARFGSVEAALAAARPSIEALAAEQFSGKISSVPTNPDPVDLTLAASLGQFADGAALAWAAGLAGSGTDIGAACFTGAWTAARYGSASGLGSWSSDPDEALDLIRSRDGVTLQQLTAFAAGFDRGPTACHP